MSRDPDAIAAEIEETRAELARAVDLIADRLSPRRAASRGASKVKAGLEGVFSSPSTDGQYAVGHYGQDTAVHDDGGIQSVPLPGGRSGVQTRTVRTLRKDRVAIVVVAAAAVTALVVVWR